MEKKVETTMMGYIGTGVYGLITRDGKENGGYKSGLYKDYYTDPFLHPG